MMMVSRIMQIVLCKFNSYEIKIFFIEKDLFLYDAGILIQIFNNNNNNNAK